MFFSPGSSNKAFLHRNVNIKTKSILEPTHFIACVIGVTNLYDRLDFDVSPVYSPLVIFLILAPHSMFY